MSDTRFDQLVEEALAQDFSGWDFSWLRGRWSEEDPSWDYRQLVVERLGAARALLDMGTGGGEFLATLPHLPAESYASESYEPNASSWSLQQELSQLTHAGLQVSEAQEELLDTTFFDIGAVVFYLKVIAWQIPDFDVSRYRARLLAMHDQIQRQGAFHAQSHRFLIEACKPGPRLGSR